MDPTPDVDNGGGWIDRLEFAVGDERRSLTDVGPDEMLLDYLREVEHRTGTKEGCASGDCGACTVLLAMPGPEGRLRTVNSCITHVGSLHGSQVLTIEDVAAGADLHPVQRAMVEGNGSQCGFCTPGIVMSLYAMAIRDSGDDPLRSELAGNLCRCTGYRPILDAARAALVERTPRPSLEILGALADAAAAPTRVRGSSGSVHAPVALSEALETLAAEPESTVVAGGTDVALDVTQALDQSRNVIHIGRVAELLRISTEESHRTFGAAVTYTDLRDPLCELYPDCSALLDRFGSPQIRNRGTLGGNLGTASPIGDMIPILLALDAEVSIASLGEVRRINVADFVVGYRTTALRPGELIVAIHIPLPTEARTFQVHKVTKRIDDDISTVLLAIDTEVDGDRFGHVRVALGGMAAMAKRAPTVEEDLAGQPLSAETIQTAADGLLADFSPLSDVRASSDYRHRVARGLLERSYLRLIRPDDPVEVHTYSLAAIRGAERT